MAKLTQQQGGPTMSQAPVDILGAAEQETLVASLTRDALNAAAPEELGVFRAHEQDFLSGRPPRPADKSDQTLGVGLELAGLLTPFVVAGVKELVKFMFQVLRDAASDEIKEAVKAWIKGVLRHGATGPSGQEDPAPEPPLPAELVRRVKDAVRATVLQMGADQNDADLVASAVVGRIVTG